MKIKKLLSLIAAAAMTVTATVGAMTASAFNEADWYAEGDTLWNYYGPDTEFELPTELNGNQLKIVAGDFGSSFSWTSVTIPEGYTEIGERSFSTDSLQSITLPSSLKIIGPSAFRACSSPNLVIDIQSTSLTSVGANAFKNVVGTIKVYTQEMYDLISSNATAANVVLGGNTELDYSKLREAVSNAGKYQETAYTADSYKTLTDAAAAGNAVLSNESATQTDIDNAAKAINDAIAGLTFKGYSELETLIGQADDIVNNHADEYVSLANLNSVLSEAKPVLENAKAGLTEELQVQVNDYAQKVKEQIDALEKVDIPAELKKLQTVIESAEALSASEYTEESYKALTDAINEAKKITESSTYSEIISAKTAVTNAMDKLVLKPLDPFVNVYKNGAEAKVAALTADESIAGTTKIKLTFDCASDVSYNPNASIEVKTVVNGTESYEKFIGTDGSYKNGTTDWTVELPLTSEIKSGDSVNITAYTYAWKNASDYVYAIKKVDFVDATGYILKTMTDRTVAQDKLSEAITKAEEIKADDYTAESYASVTEAVKAAKALKDEATVEEINAAETAIKDAVKALTYKPADYTKVDEAIAKIPVDLSKYTDESVKALNTAKEAVIRDKNITEQETVDGYAKAINDAISALKVKPTPTKPNTTNPTTKATRSKEAVKKDKSAAKKAMKQAKISKLKVKSKAKKKINVTWKKVKKAKGYQVQVSAKKNFKKVIFKKDLKKIKLTIKNKKIKSKKTYYVRVRAYATYKNANNKTVKVYSKWNKKLRKITVK